MRVFAACCVAIALLSTGCFLAPNTTSTGKGAAASPDGERTVASQESLSGMVDFGARRPQAAIEDVASGATVSLIDVPTGNTIATTLTTPQGAFNFNFGRGWRPRTNAPYYLEAVKGLNNNQPGYAGVRLRTILVYQNGWTSLTNKTSKSGGVYVTPDTTAISVITAYHPDIETFYLMGTVAHGQADNSLEPPTESTFDPTDSGITNAAFHQVAGMVSQALADDSDPMFRIRYNAVFDVYTLASLSGGGGGYSPTGPTIQGLSALVGGPGMTLVLSGLNFGPGLSDNAVSFNGAAGTVIAASPTELSVIVPPDATTGLIRVVNAAGESNGIQFVVLDTIGGALRPTQNTPVMTALSPLAVTPGATVSITGAGFDPDPQANQVYWSGRMIRPSAASSTSLTVTLPPDWGSGEIKVGRVGIKSNGLHLTVGDPVLVAASARTVLPGEVFTLAGANFVPIPGANTVQFAGATGTVLAATTETLTVRAPLTPDLGPVSVQTGGGTSAAVPLMVVADSGGKLDLGTPPTISALSLSEGPVGIGVVITGAHFSADPREIHVRFNGKPATLLSVAATSLTVVVPAGATTGPVTVTTPAGVAKGPVFTINADSVTDPFLNGPPLMGSVSPTIGLPGTPVVIEGSNFDPIISNNQVHFNGTPAAITSGTSRRLTVTVPAGATSGDVTVTHSGGTTTGFAFQVISGVGGSFSP
ncbi:IPT/TIG domain protein [compost metagenome]